MLHKTTNLLDDEAARMLQSPSDLDVESPRPQGTPGQREIDSDEMNEEMMDEYPQQVQMGWKISDAPTPSAAESEEADSTTD